MIIKMRQAGDAPSSTGNAGAASQIEFGRIDVLQLTSSDLEAKYSLRLGDMDVHTPFELASSLSAVKADREAPKIRMDRVVRLIQQHDDLLPCFVCYQEDAGRVFPFMTDGPPGLWSLFFQEDGSMTLVRRSGGKLAATRFGSQEPQHSPRPRNGNHAAALRAGVSSARKYMSKVLQH